MATMTAYQLTGWQKPAEFVEVEVPRPGPGEVLVKVAGVGLCHSDLLFLDVPEGFFAYELPFTLGHEIAGWVDEVGRRRRRPGVSVTASWSSPGSRAGIAPTA